MELWIGVHDVLTALIAERLPIDGLWLSSYGLSAARLGMPDAGFLTPQDVATTCRLLSDRTALPVIIDAENGYGLEEAELADVAAQFASSGARGLCVEDSIGPKLCSLWENTDRALASVDVMCERIRALRHGFGPEGRIIARTEGLIEGHTHEQVADRVEAYAAAGAWGVVVHFRDDPEAAVKIGRSCRHLCPLVIIPTAEPERPMSDWSRNGFTVYVAANLALRVAARATERGLLSLVEDRLLANALADGMSIAEIDHLVRAGDVVDR